MKHREVKFRAWIKEHNKMVDVWQINYVGFPNKEIQSIASSFVINSHYIFYKDQFELMQYSGLKDKNGKSYIYEKDILKINLPAGGFWGVTTEKIGVVKYESDYGGYIVEWEYSKNQHHVRLDCDIAFTSEVLGNTFQHSHLIK